MPLQFFDAAKAMAKKAVGDTRSSLDDELNTLLWQSEENLNRIIEILVPDKMAQKKIAEGRIQPPEDLIWSVICRNF